MIDITVKFEETDHTVEEGMTVSVCVCISSPIQRDIFVNMTTSQQSASGN